MAMTVLYSFVIVWILIQDLPVWAIVVFDVVLAAAVIAIVIHAQAKGG